MTPGDKQSAQLEQLQRAASVLDRVLAQPENEIQNIAAIKSFEFCYELSWRLMKRLVEEQSGDAPGPRAAFREAARLGIIDNPEDWLDFSKNRNLTVHTYNEDVSRSIYKVVKNDFAPALDKLINTKFE